MNICVDTFSSSLLHCIVLVDDCCGINDCHFVLSCIVHKRRVFANFQGKRVSHCEEKGGDYYFLTMKRSL